MAWEGTEALRDTEGTEPRVSPLRRCSAEADELFLKVLDDTEWSESPAREERDVCGTCVLGLLWTAKDIGWRVPTVIRSDVSPESTAWGGSRKIGREESTAHAASARFPFPCLCQSRKCKGDKDFPCLPALQQGSCAEESDF